MYDPYMVEKKFNVCMLRAKLAGYKTNCLEMAGFARFCASFAKMD